MYPFQSSVNWSSHVFIDEGSVHDKGRVGGLEGRVCNTDHRSVSGSPRLRLGWSVLIIDPVVPLLAGSVQDVSDSLIPDLATA